MLKRICRLAAAVCAAAALLIPTGRIASAARIYPEYNENCGLYDIQGVVDEETEQALDACVRETAQRLDMYVAVVIVGPETPIYSDSDAVRFADDKYTEFFNSDPAGEDTDGILLLINNATNYDYITTSGTGQIYFTNDPANDRIDMIFDDIWDAVLRKDYPGVVEDFCDSIEYYYYQGYSSQDYVYEPGKGYGMIENGVLVWKDEPPKDYGLWFGTAVCSVIAGVITAVGVYFGVKKAYRFKESLNPTRYICSTDSVMHESTDVFLREHTSKVRIQSSSGGGGGGGGGHSHSHGGRSRGGGGRHR